MAMNEEMLTILDELIRFCNDRYPFIDAHVDVLPGMPNYIFQKSVDPDRIELVIRFAKSGELLKK